MIHLKLQHEGSRSEVGWSTASYLRNLFLYLRDESNPYVQVGIFEHSIRLSICGYNVSQGYPRRRYLLCLLALTRMDGNVLRQVSTLHIRCQDLQLGNQRRNSPSTFRTLPRLYPFKSTTIPYYGIHVSWSNHTRWFCYPLPSHIP